MKFPPTATLVRWLCIIFAGWGWIGEAEAASAIADQISPTSTITNNTHCTTSPMRTAWRWATTDMGYAQSCDSVCNDLPKPDPELQELATGLKEMAGMAVSLAGGLVEAVLTMDHDKMAKFGGQFKDMFMSSIEVFQALWDTMQGEDSYKKGYLTGKATSEVAGIFLPWAKAAKALKAVQGAGRLSKAKFLVELGERSKFFGTGGRGQKR